MAKTTKKATSKIEEAEIIEETTATGTVIVLDQATKNDIAKFDVNKSVITKTKKKYASLEIKGVDDKKGYKAVDEARKDMWKKGTTLENKRKEIKADILQRGRDIDNYAKEIEGLINLGDGGLDDLKAKLKFIDDLKKAEAERIEREEREALEKMVTDLEGAGIVFDGRFYTLGTISVTLDVLKGIPAEGFEILVQNVKNEKFRLDEEKRLTDEAEAKRIQDIENQRLENEKTANELKEREDKLKEAEAKLIESRTESRKGQLMGLGLGVNGDWFMLLTPSGNIEISLDTVKTEDDAKWMHRIETTQNAILDINRIERVRIEEDNRKSIRIGKLIGVGYVEEGDVMVFRHGADSFQFGKVAFLPLEEESFDIWFAKMHTYASDFVDKIEKDKEDVRVAALNDVQKVEDWLVNFQKVLKTNHPKFESEKIQTLFSDFIKGAYSLNDLLKKHINQ